MSLAEQEIRKARAELSSEKYLQAIGYIESAISELNAASLAIDRVDKGTATDAERKEGELEYQLTPMERGERR